MVDQQSCAAEACRVTEVVRRGGVGHTGSAGDLAQRESGCARLLMTSAATRRRPRRRSRWWPLNSSLDAEAPEVDAVREVDLVAVSL